LEVKTQLTKQDMALIALSLLIVLNGALVSFQLVPYASILISVLSYFTMVFIQICKKYSQPRNKAEEKQNNLESFFDFDDKKNTSLNLMIFFVMPFFPISYLLGFIKVLDSNNLLIAYCIGSLLGKGVFCSYLSNSHVCLQSLLTKSRLKIEELKRSNDMRNLIANVAHDLKTVSLFLYIVLYQMYCIILFLIFKHLIIYFRLFFYSCCYYNK
jgi:hypothetical protein